MSFELLNASYIMNRKKLIEVLKCDLPESFVILPSKCTARA